MKNTSFCRNRGAVALLLLATGCPFALRAQSKTVQEQQVMNDVGSFANTPTAIRTFNFSTVGLKGSPLLLPNWVPGEITFMSGRKLTVEKANYDVFERQLTFKRTVRDSVRYQADVVKEFTLLPANQPALRFEHMPATVVTTETALKNDLVRVVHKGTYTLVELPVRKFVKATSSQPYGGSSEANDEFKDESVYYLIRPDQTAERVKLTKKSLMGALQTNGPAFDTYLKTNKLDSRLEADVVRALASLDAK